MEEIIKAIVKFVNNIVTNESTEEVKKIIEVKLWREHIMYIEKNQNL